MAQFCVYRIPEGLVLDVQSDLVEARGTRVVVPFSDDLDTDPPLSELEPTLMIDGQEHVLLTGEIASIPARFCVGEPVVDLRGEQDAIKRALDFLFYGF